MSILVLNMTCCASKTKIYLNLRKKEIFWLIGTLTLTLVLIFLVFDLDSLKPKSVTDINVHDTYFVIPTFYFVVSFCVLIFFGVYLIRMLRRNFKNKTANLIFLAANILLVLKITQLISILNAFAQISETETSIRNGLMAFSNVLLVIQVFLLILLTFSGIKTGLNYIKK